MHALIETGMILAAVLSITATVQAFRLAWEALKQS